MKIRKVLPNFQIYFSQSHYLYQDTEHLFFRFRALQLYILRCLNRRLASSLRLTHAQTGRKISSAR